jgi:hypothetical protein
MIEGMQSVYKIRSGTPEDFRFIGFVQKESMGPYIISQYGRWDDEAQRKQLLASDPCEHQIFEISERPIGCALVKREPVAWFGSTFFPHIRDRE